MDRLTRLQALVAERGGVNQMSPVELRSIGSQLREAAVSRDVDSAIQAQSIRSDYQRTLYQSTLHEVESVQGDWTHPESSAPLVFVFEGDNVAWAPFVAQAGAPVGVIVETAFQAKAMEELLNGLLGKEIADLSEEQRPYQVVSMDVAIDRDFALETIRKHFQRPWLPTIKPVTFSVDASAEEIEQILRRYGLRFDTSPMPHLIGVDRYLGALA